ncbi:unnamed protein product, partial [Discosporangium mesarthrocarpum]
MENAAVILILYVDDIILTGSSTSAIQHVKEGRLSKLFMSDLGAVSVLLGIKINRNRSSGHLQLSQDHYVKSILERFNMSQCNPTTTPADGIIDSSGTPLDSAGIHLYQELVGSFIYLATCNRPDIAFAVMRLSRFMAKPT